MSEDIDNSTCGDPCVVVEESATTVSELDILQTIVKCYLVQMVAILGSVGSIFTIMILHRNGLNDVTNMILASMAVCDFLFLSTLAVHRADCIIQQFDLVLAYSYNAYTQVYIRTPSRMMMVLSSHHAAVIAVERFIAVRFPFHAKQWITLKRVKIFLASMYVAAIAMFAPYNYALVITDRFDNFLNRSVLGYKLSDFYIANTEGLEVFNTLVMAFFISYAKLVLVIVCCAAVLHKLIQMSNARSKMTSGKYQFDVKTSQMLLVVCLMYVTTRLYSGAIFAYRYSVQNAGTSGSTFAALLILDDLFQAVNSGANFIIYIRMSSKFYASWKSLFACCEANGQSQKPSPYSGAATEVTISD